MDAALRRYERDGDTQRYLIAYARTIGATFAGNIKSRCESLWLWRSTGEADRARDRQYYERIRRRRHEAKIKWLQETCKDRKHHIVAKMGDYEKIYLYWDGTKHIEVEHKKYMATVFGLDENHRVVVKDGAVVKGSGKWFEMTVSYNETNQVYLGRRRSR